MTQPAPSKPKWQVSSHLRSHARALRKDMTPAERIIWYAVRAHRLSGAAFRRQVPIGPYIADFVSHAAMLIVEIDGGQHFEDVHEQRDAVRDAYLNSKGYRVLRFDNREVVTNRHGVLTRIAEALGEAAPSLPSPASGRGGEAAASERKSPEPSR